MTSLNLTVIGWPAPQGSKRAWVNKATGRAQMREQSGDKIQLWRQDVKAAAMEALDAYEAEHNTAYWGPNGPLLVHLEFYFPRPKSHYRTGANAHLLRPNAPAFPVTRATGDADKLCRATLDALVVARVMADDAQVAVLRAEKHYTEQQPGAHIIIRSLDGAA